MFDRILIPLDGSPFAEHALQHALGLMSRHPIELHILLANYFAFGLDAGWMPQPEVYSQALFDSEETYLTDLRGRLGAAGVERLVVHHDSGDPVELVSRITDEADIDLIVMSTHGRGGFQRAYLGSVADGVIRHAAVPVLLVRPTEEETQPELTPVLVQRLLVALDGSPVAEGALSAALAVAAEEGAHCTVLQVVVPPIFISSYVPDTQRLTQEKLDEHSAHAQAYLSGLEQRVPDVDASRVVVHQQPAVAILYEAEALGVDMIAVGTRGMSRFARMFIGSVADKVVRGATVPVLVVPAKARKTGQEEV